MMGRVRVLVVEDDVRMAAAIRRGLRFEGLVVDVAADGEQALRTVGATDYDAIVLDVMLPGLDGFETCRRLRADGVWVPVLMLTARDAVEDRVRGLDGGADDYLTKPFSLAELTARLRALARRGPIERPAVLRSATCASTPRRARCGAATWRSSSPRASSCCSRRSCAGRARCSLRSSSWRRPGISATSIARTSSRSTCATCARRSTGRSGVSSIETVRGAGYRLRKDGGM